MQRYPTKVFAPIFPRLRHTYYAESIEFLPKGPLRSQ
jgi:hypothetical protein